MSQRRQHTEDARRRISEGNKRAYEEGTRKRYFKDCAAYTSANLRTIAERMERGESFDTIYREFVERGRAKLRAPMGPRRAVIATNLVTGEERTFPSMVSAARTIAPERPEISFSICIRRAIDRNEDLHGHRWRFVEIPTETPT